MADANTCIVFCDFDQQERCANGKQQRSYIATQSQSGNRERFLYRFPAHMLALLALLHKTQPQKALTG